MKKKVLFYLVIFLLAADLYAEKMQSVKVQDMQFSWEISNGNLVVEILAPTEGWIAVGFNPSKMMKDANIIIGYVDDNGKTVVNDHYGTSPIGHKADTDIGGTDDITIISGSQNGGATRIKFSIPLSSGDIYDSELKAGAKTVILLAYGDSDKITKKHSKKYETEVTL